MVELSIVKQFQCKSKGDRVLKSGHKESRPWLCTPTGAVCIVVKSPSALAEKRHSCRVLVSWSFLLSN